MLSQLLSPINKVTYNTVDNVFIIVLTDQMEKDKLSSGTVRYEEAGRVYLKSTDQLGYDNRGSLSIRLSSQLCSVNIFIKLDETNLNNTEYLSRLAFKII